MTISTFIKGLRTKSLKSKLSVNSALSALSTSTLYTSALSTNSAISTNSVNSANYTQNPFKSDSITGYLRSFGGAFPPLSSLPLPSPLFAAPQRLDLIHRVVCWFRAGERVGLASAKGRGEVAGSNRKIHAQKGTGRARAGDARAPHRRGGGASFGPKPRDFSFTLPLKLRWLAFRSALSEKYRQGQVSIVTSSSLQLSSHKTGAAAKLLEGFARPDANSPRKMLILGTEPSESPSLRNLILATRTLDGAQVDYIQVDQADLIKNRYKLKQHQKHPVTAYHLIKYHHVCITPEAIDFYKTINETI